MHWIPKMHESPVKTRLIIASPKSSLKPLARTVTSILSSLFRQIQTYNGKCWFFTGVHTFWVVQSNKPVIDAMHGLNKHNKESCLP